jgi:hypothetical protein
MVNHLALSKNRFGNTQKLSLSENNLFSVFVLLTPLCIGVIVFRSIIPLTHVVTGLSSSEGSPMEFLRDWQICEEEGFERIYGPNISEIIRSGERLLRWSMAPKYDGYS